MKSKRVPPRWSIRFDVILVAILVALGGWGLYRQARRGCLRDGRDACDPAASFPHGDTRDARRIEPCRIHAAAPLSPDTISPASRCAAVRIAWGELRRMPNAEPHIAPGDTARIDSVRVFDLDREDGLTGEVTPLRHVEVDIHGRPRLFVVAFDRRTGAVTHRGIVHR